jgi:hypothetical protein
MPNEATVSMSVIKNPFWSALLGALLFPALLGCGDVNGQEAGQESTVATRDQVAEPVQATCTADSVLPAGPGSIQAALPAAEEDSRDPQPASGMGTDLPRPRSDRPEPDADVTRAGSQMFLVDGKWPVREIHPGRPLQPSVLEQAPGYRPLEDPELESVVSGRRVVGETDIPFMGGAASAEELARSILMNLNYDDRRGLHELRVTYDEFRDILWPEFPQSRPATNIQANDAWFFLTRTCSSAVNGALDEWYGHDLVFSDLSFDGGLIRYTNFNMYSGVRIHAILPPGEEVEVIFAHTFAERSGVWKVYIYKD